MYDEMSPEQIAEMIAESKVRVAELEQAMESKRASVVDALLTHIRSHASLYGLDIAKIAAELAPPVAVVDAPKKRRESSGDRSPAKLYVLAGDPSKTYSRGKMPTWMHQAMSAGGYDPAVKEDRERFKAEKMSLAA